MSEEYVDVKLLTEEEVPPTSPPDEGEESTLYI